VQRLQKRDGDVSDRQEAAAVDEKIITEPASSHCWVLAGRCFRAAGGDVSGAADPGQARVERVTEEINLRVNK
jgi:hypothetical protein